jgi:hypothetical protein
LFPHYIQFCSASQYYPHKGHGAKGTKAGHAVWYLKGVCTDYSNEPSGLKICDEKDKERNPELGVGLSTNKILSNVNFLVVPGKDLFFRGGCKKEDVFTVEKKQELVDRVDDLGLFNKVNYHSYILSDSLSSEQQTKRIIDYSLGSDFALALARSLSCVYVPLPKEIMKLVVADLNKLNSSYIKNPKEFYRRFLFIKKKIEKKYHWSGIFDNCTHTPRSVFASLGVLPPTKINRSFFKQLSYITVPTNTVLDLYRSLNLRKISVKSLWKNKRIRYLLQNHDWFPFPYGVLAEKIEMHTNNKIFKKSDNMFVRKSLFEERSNFLRDLHKQDEFSYSYAQENGFRLHSSMVKDKYKYLQKQIVKAKQKRKYRNCLRAEAEDQNCRDYLGFVDKLDSVTQRRLNSL